MSKNILKDALIMVSDSQDVNFFIFDLFKNAPLTFFSYKTGWFHFYNKGEMAFRYENNTKVNNFFVYKIELSFQPLEVTEFKTKDNKNITLDDFMNGEYGEYDNFKHINLRLYQYGINTNKNPKSETLLFELELK